MRTFVILFFGMKQLVVVASVVIFFYTCLNLYLASDPSFAVDSLSPVGDMQGSSRAQASDQVKSKEQTSISDQGSDGSLIPEALTATPDHEGAADPEVTGTGSHSHPATGHLEIFSRTTPDGSYLPIDFRHVQGMNPNLLPHPILESAWITVAQRWHAPGDQSVWFSEIACVASIDNCSLRCLDPPTILPIDGTVGGMCQRELEIFNDNIGPHDARVFWGPRTPYAIYGSNSQLTCFGQFIEDFRMLFDMGPAIPKNDPFRMGTELQRPLPVNAIEKNWFAFWDSNDEMYMHYDVAPQRSFARIYADGSAGPNLGPSAAALDSDCLARHLPALGPELESIHQATNSLRITMCKRSGTACVPSDSNTFIFAIYQHKTFFNYHSVYEPYVMVFRQQSPFEIFAMSRRPFWIHGRRTMNDGQGSEMLYITSMSWKDKSNRYHGFLDDEMFIGFGIEDQGAGVVDVLASDLLSDLGLCAAAAKTATS